MEIEDGVIWVYGVGEDGILAFTDFGIENLIELIRIRKDDPTLLRRYSQNDQRGGPLSGGPFRKTCRRVRPSMDISICGAGIARSISYITSSM